MGEVNNIKIECDSLRVQLEQLNERTRWYSSQLWQAPFAFFGITAIFIGTMFNNFKDAPIIIGLLFFAIFVLGIAVLSHIKYLAEGEKRAVDDLQDIEKQLHIKKNVQHMRKIWFSFRIGVVVVTFVCFLLGIYFIIRNCL